MSSTVAAEQLLHSIPIQLYIDMACATLWIYEYILTFGEEISLVWNAPWTIPTVLFLLSRYWPSVTLTILLYHDFQPGLSDENCLASQRFVIWSITATTFVAETILTIRTKAVWGGGRNVTIFLSSLFFVTGIPSIVIVGIWQDTLQLTSVPVEVVPSRCWPITKSSLYFANYILVAICEGVLFTMIAIKGYKALKDGPINSRLFYAVYTNGVMYYVYMFILSVINIVINMHAPHAYGNLFSMFQQVVHSVLACRMLLQLRKCGKQNFRGDDLQEFGSAFTLHPNTLVLEAAAAAGTGEDCAHSNSIDGSRIGSTVDFRKEDKC